jgi:SAM-dependent methyltransferase
MSIDFSNREGACPCCLSVAPGRRWGVVSSFLSRRALLESPRPVARLICVTCGHSWSARGLSEEEIRRLYSGYRDDAYLQERRRYEPWYSRAVNDGMGGEDHMTQRRAVLARSLAHAERSFGKRPAGRALDHGGDRGQMLRDLPDPERMVFDISGVAADPWARAVHAEELARASGFELILNCQVLEHVNDPRAFLEELYKATAGGGWIYLEVPDERWRESFGFEAARLAWLRFVCRRPALLKALDFLSTGCRVKLGWMPPLGFWVLREHLNFFTPQSLRLLMQGVGFEVAFSELSKSGISAVGRKN